jgi:hypothetical protein
VQSGAINAVADVNLFKIISSYTGEVVLQDTTASSSLVGALIVYNYSDAEIASTTDTLNAGSSQVAVSLTAGDTYYVQAGQSLGEQSDHTEGVERGQCRKGAENAVP